MTNVLQVSRHHGGSQTLPSHGGVNDNTVNTEDVSKGIMILHKVIGDGACIVGSGGCTDETNEVVATLEKSYVAQVFGDDGAILEVERGGSFVRRVRAGFEANDTVKVDDLNLLQGEVVVTRGLGHSADEEGR